jgi:hypothetical protein
VIQLHQVLVSHELEQYGDEMIQLVFLVVMHEVVVIHLHINIEYHRLIFLVTVDELGIMVYHM